MNAYHTYALYGENVTFTEHLSRFKAPFTLDTFRGDIAEVLLHYMRTYVMLVGASTEKAYESFGVAPDPENPEPDDIIFDSESSAVNLGLTYERIKHMDFVQTLERMYDFAYEGRLDSSYERMEDESHFSFVSALVVDALNGEFAEEWTVRGSNGGQGLSRCVSVAELANARNVLEGGESFFSRFSPSRSLDHLKGLTIRQMALLAGMEEMSVRAAANPKRANPLKTVSDSNGTYIELRDAKEWLASKGLYVPVSYHIKSDLFDLSARGFSSTSELRDVLWARLHGQFDTLGKRATCERLPEAIRANYKRLFDIDDATLQNEGFIKELAVALELPARLLYLRIIQVYAEEKLRTVKSLISQAID